MTTITVRRPEFDWPADLPPVPIESDRSRSAELVALSFTLPALEPYLIRTMRVAAKEIADPGLAEEVKAFSGQEAQHYKNHARINDVVRSKLSPAAARRMSELEAALDADYRRFSAEKSLAFNLAYAEGFEAMTFALARSAMSVADFEVVDPNWAHLLSWHLAEEVEHRTVTFDAHHHIVGSYPQRLAVGSWAQAHFLRSLMHMALVLRRDLGEPDITVWRTLRQSARRNWRNGMIGATLRAALPGYDPGTVVISDEIRTIGSLYDIDFDLTGRDRSVP